MALSDNLISAWELDEASGDAIDSHSTNDLTDTNTVASGTGLVNATARDFERNNTEYFTVASNASLAFGDEGFTIEAWVNPETSGTTRQMIVAKDTDTSREYTLALADGNASQFNFTVYGPGDSSAINANTFGSVSTGTWYQVIAWHDPTNNVIGICVNAGTADTGAHSVGANDGTAPFGIGRRAYPGFNDTFDGLIGPVRLWGRVLTSGERTSLYNSGSGLTYSAITSGGTTTLIADAGSYAVTGRAANLLQNYALISSNGSYTLSGQNATLINDQKVVAGTGSYSLNGQSVNLLKGRSVVADSGSFALTGQDTLFDYDRNLTAANGSFTLSGQDATLTKSGTPGAADAGTYTLSGQNAGLTAARKVTAAVGSFALTGQDAALLRNRTLTAANGSFTVTGQTATLDNDQRMTADTGTYQLRGKVAHLLAPGDVISDNSNITTLFA